jgi:hypothetical protein
MVNKEKLLLLATIYMLVPGAMPDVLADSSTSEVEKNKSKRLPDVHKQLVNNTGRRRAAKSGRKSQQ